ncbi:hypothetical protein EYF80_061476 [Liparis tanakae]|uniref:Uncharacterized protein n=1 Tax=Liparis tanakae TaxID=230148 RepID=A0A4Z2EHH6_9TELE|nr:hypothetical protein EYF80_061476 [Liparis tanakae]
MTLTPMTLTPVSLTPVSLTPVSLTPLTHVSLTPVSLTPVSLTPLTPMTLTPMTLTPVSLTPLTPFSLELYKILLDEGSGPDSVPVSSGEPTPITSSLASSASWWAGSGRGGAAAGDDPLLLSIRTHRRTGYIITGPTDPQVFWFWSHQQTPRWSGSGLTNRPPGGLALVSPTDPQVLWSHQQTPRWSGSGLTNRPPGGLALVSPTDPQATRGQPGSVVTGPAAGGGAELVPPGPEQVDLVSWYLSEAQQPLVGGLQLPPAALRLPQLPVPDLGLQEPDDLLVVLLRPPGLRPPGLRPPGLRRLQAGLQASVLLHGQGGLLSSSRDLLLSSMSFSIT